MSEQTDKLDAVLLENITSRADEAGRLVISTAALARLAKCPKARMSDALERLVSTGKIGRSLLKGKQQLTVLFAPGRSHGRSRAAGVVRDGRPERNNENTSCQVGCATCFGNGFYVFGGTSLAACKCETGAEFSAAAGVPFADRTDRQHSLLLTAAEFRRENGLATTREISEKRQGIENSLKKYAERRLANLTKRGEKVVLSDAALLAHDCHEHGQPVGYLAGQYELEPDDCSWCRGTGWIIMTGAAEGRRVHCLDCKAGLSTRNAELAEYRAKRLLPASNGKP